MDSATHHQEVKRGERFEFGKNWARFLRVLNDRRIGLAERSLVETLKFDRLDGLTFLDVGSGSGLFSLSARRLGARVYSFDYDPHSVACTQELKRRYFPDDQDWTIEQGSVLDQAFLGKLGTFDIVYSWGVLHHTGRMWQALDNVKPLVCENGSLYIAIYNDLGPVTDHWAAVKQRYNRLPGPAAMLFAFSIIAQEESRSLASKLRSRQFKPWLHSWTRYAEESTRGMSKWHDWIDWIGGRPYERATVEQVVDHYGKDGFRLINLVDRSHGTGCNEFVFRREGKLGRFIENRIPRGKSPFRRFGYKVRPPFEIRGSDVVAALPAELMDCTTPLQVFLEGRLVGEGRVAVGGQIMFPLPTGTPRLADDFVVYIVPGVIRRPAEPIFHSRRKMYAWKLADLSALADDKTGSASPVYLLDDGRPLPLPHSLHDEIATRGGGRYSHWGEHVLFALEGLDEPQQYANHLSVLIAAEPSQNRE